MAETKTTKMNLGTVLANGAVGALADAGGSILSAGLGSLLSALPGHTILGSLGRSMTGSGLTGAQIEANQFSHNEAELAFQRELSADSTKYQRMVADANKAGLNPVFLAGSGAGSVSSPAATSVSPSAPNLSALIQNVIASKQLKLQERMTDAQIANINADTDKKKADTTGQNIANQIAEATKDVKIEASRLDNQLSSANAKLLEEKRKEVVENIRKMAAETSSEVAKSEYYYSAAAFKRMSTYEISQMLAYKKRLAEAQTQEAKAAAGLAAAHQAYQEHLIDDGYLQAFILNEQNLARKSGQEVLSAEAKAQLDQIRAAIRTGNYEATSLVEIPVVTEFLSGISNFLDNFNPLAGLLK